MSFNNVSKHFANKKLLLVLLSLIFAGALALRISNLGQMPSGFHRDEAISGYVGRFILQNGKDLYGNPFPLLYFDKYGDYPPVIPMYVSGLGTYVFGANIFATRFPVALIGALLIFPLFFLAKEFFKDTRIALISSAILAILPWHIVLSRATAEGVIALTIVTTGLFCLMRAIDKQKNLLLIAAVLLLLLTYLIYPTYRILAPLILLPIPFIFPLKSKMKILVVASILVLGLVTILISSTTWGRGRYDQTSIFSAQNEQQIKNAASTLAQEEGPNHILEAKIFYNKYVLYGRQIIAQYFAYFSPDYLLISGGLPYRYAVPDDGLIYLAMVPLLLAGFLFILKIDKKKAIYLLYLLLISPLPAPITVDDIPNVHRTLFMVIPLVLIASYGAVCIFSGIKKSNIKKVGLLVLVVIFAVELTYFLHMYNNHANALKSFERDDSNVEVMQYLISQKNKYDKVYFTDNDALPIYYLLLTNNFDKSIAGKFRKNLKTDQFDNVVFTDLYCPEKLLDKNDLKKNILIVDSTDCQADIRLTINKTFSRHDGTTSYRFSTPTR